MERRHELRQADAAVADGDYLQGRLEADRGDRQYVDVGSGTGAEREPLRRRVLRCEPRDRRLGFAGNAFRRLEERSSGRGRDSRALGSAGHGADPAQAGNRSGSHVAGFRRQLDFRFRRQRGRRTPADRRTAAGHPPSDAHGRAARRQPPRDRLSDDRRRRYRCGTDRRIRLQGDRARDMDSAFHVSRLPLLGAFRRGDAAGYLVAQGGRRAYRRVPARQLRVFRSADQPSARDGRTHDAEQYARFADRLSPPRALRLARRRACRVPVRELQLRHG